MNIKTIIAAILIALICAAATQAYPACGAYGGGYYRGGGCGGGWNGGAGYYRCGGGYCGGGWNGGGYGGGYCNQGGWYGTGIPNGLGWTLFGLTAAAGISAGAAWAAQPPVQYVQPAPQVIYINR